MTQPSNILSNEKMEFNSGDPPLEHYYEHPFFWKVSKIEKILIAAGIALNNSKKKDKSESNPATNLTSDDSAAEASETKIPKLEEGKDKPQTNPVANVDSGVDASTNTITEPQNATNESQPDPDNLVFDSMAKENLILGDKNDWKIRLDEIEKLTRSDELIEVDSICYYLTTNFGNKEPWTWEKAFKKELKNEKMEELKEKLNEKTSRLSELVICVRDKLAHLSDLPQSGLKKLGFIEDPPTNFKSKQFVQNIIINGFPSLVAFVGIQKAAEDDLGDLYKYRETLKYHPKDFLNQMETALQEHKSRGGLKKRYKAKRSTGEEITLEFRWAKDMKLTSNTMAAVVGEEEMKIFWMDKTETTQQQNKTIKQQNEVTKQRNEKPLTYALSSKTKLSKVTIIFATEAEKVDLEFLETHCAGNRIIILANTVAVENLTKVVHTLSSKFNCDFIESDVEWKEVESVLRENILKQKVKFDESVVPLKQFLPQVDSNIIGIFENLKGDELNEFLRGEPPIIFDKCKLPYKPSIYLPRKLHERATLISEYIKAKNNILIVFGASYVNVSNLFENTTDVEIHNIQHSEQFEKQQQREIWKYEFPETVSKKTAVFVMEEHVETSREIFDAIKQRGWETDYNIHFLNYVEKNRLIPLESIGSKLTENLKAQNDCFTEDKLLDEISEKVRAVMVADQPGMGKTYLMKSLANKLAAKIPDSDCALLDIETFVDKLRGKSKAGKLELDKDRIINALTELMCTSTFKKQIAKMWLNETVSGKLKVNVLFDGLDEATSESRTLLIQALKLINEQISTVRVWVAMRDHVHQDVQNFKNVVHIKIMPFSEEDQVDYIEKELWKYIRAHIDPTDKLPSETDIKTFSKECTRVKVFGNDANITGIPLQCYLISQVYAERVLANNLKMNGNSSTTLVQLYQKLIYQKSMIYLGKMGFKVGLKRTQFCNDNYLRMLHRLIYYALKLIVSEQVADWYNKTIQLGISKSEEFTSDILSFGLLESIEPLQFVHRTFAEFIVARFFHLVLTDNFDSRIQKQDTYFRQILQEEILEFNARFIRDATDFKYPNVARFLEFCLADSMNQAEIYPNGNNFAMLQNVQGNLTNERINLAMSRLLYDKIEPSRFDVKSHKELSKYFEIKISKFNFFQHLIVIAAENKLQNLVERLILYAQIKQTKRMFPVMEKKGVFECVARAFVNKENLFLVHPTSELKEFLKKIVNKMSYLSQFLSPMIYDALKVLISEGDLNQYQTVDWVIFFLTELIPNFQPDCKQTLLHDLTLNAMRSVGESDIISKHSLEIWKSLVNNNGCDPTSRNGWNKTPFHLGISSCPSKDRFFFIDELGHCKKFVNETDGGGNSLLLLAANNKNCTVKLIKKLKKAGGDVNIANNKGQTCLMLAVKNNRLGIVKFLCKLGADANLKDNNGDSAVAYVGRYGSFDCSVGIMKFMVKNNVDIASENKLKQNVLHIACEHNNLNLVRFLLKGIMDNKFNMSLRQKDKSGKTALHHALTHFSEIHNIKSPRHFRFPNTHLTYKYDLEVALELIKAGANMKMCLISSIIPNIEANFWEMKEIVVEEHKYSEECNCEFHCEVRDIENGIRLGADDVNPTVKKDIMALYTLICNRQHHILYMGIKKIVLESEYRVSYDRLYDVWETARSRKVPERYPQIFSEIKKKSSHCMDEDN